MKTLPNRYKNNVVEKPVFADRAYSGSEKYDDLAATLKIIGSTQSVRLSEQEAVGLFGKCYKNTVGNQLRKRGINKPKVRLHNYTVHIYCTEV